MELEEIWKGLHPQCLEMAEISQLESQCWSEVCVSQGMSQFSVLERALDADILLHVLSKLAHEQYPHPPFSAYCCDAAQSRPHAEASHVGSLYYFCPAGKCSG